MKLNLLGKLLLAFTIVLVFLVIVGGVGLYQAGQINDRGNQIYSEDQVGVGLAATLERDTSRIQANVLEHVLSSDTTRKNSLETENSSLDREIDNTVQAISASDKAAPKGQSRDAVNWFWTRLPMSTVLLPPSKSEVK